MEQRQMAGVGVPLPGSEEGRWVHPAAEQARWYAVRARANHEFTAEAALQARNLPVFLPTFSVRSRWSDRVRRISKPLFPGYLFCQFLPLLRNEVVRSSGVIDIVGSGRQLIPVDEREMAYLRNVVLAEVNLSPHPFLKVGQRVRIDRGPLAGVEGILREVKAGFKLVVSITLLQRSVAVEIDSDWIDPAAV